jgi:hypothetical protein
MRQLLAVLLSLSFSTTCRPVPQRSAAPDSKGSVPPAATSSLPPLRIVVFVDQSRSMEGARVSPVAAASFAFVYDRFAASGGELAVGLIRDDSDRPFARLFVPPPPSAPSVAALPPNVFAAAAARKRENTERARYDEARRAWQSEMGLRQAAFGRSIEPLLARPADAPATDIFSALRRADVLLSEPNAFSRETRNVVILVSDGMETVAIGTPPRFNAPTEIVLVNGAGEIGSLSSFGPIRFESIDAAIRYAVAEGDAHVR